MDRDSQALSLFWQMIVETPAAIGSLGRQALMFHRGLGRSMQGCPAARCLVEIPDQCEVISLTGKQIDA